MQNTNEVHRQKKKNFWLVLVFPTQSIPGVCLCWLYVRSVWHHLAGGKGTTSSTVHKEKDFLKSWLLKERTLIQGNGGWIKNRGSITFLLILLCIIHIHNDSLLLKNLAACCFCSVIPISFTDGFYWSGRIRARTWLLLFHSWWRTTIEK